MDLLELTNKMSETQRRVKQNMVRDNGCDCEIPTMVYVFRNGEPHVGLRVHDDAIAAGFDLAWKVFYADDIAVAVDGVSRVRQREELATITASNGGEIMWKVQPYATAGRMLILPGAEVTDELPFGDPERVESEMREVLGEPRDEIPWGLAKHTEPSQRWAELDVVTAKQIRSKTDSGELDIGVTGVFLFSEYSDAGRRDVLRGAGLPVLFL